MIKITEYEAKNEEEALKNCLEELNCNENEIITHYDKIEGTLFKKNKTILKVIKKSDIIEYINSFLKNLSKLMNVNIETEVLESNDSYNITLVSAQNSILIGKEGRTLNAIQTLLRQSLKNETKMNIKINVDISNYKFKKLKTLENEIEKIAKEVLQTKINVSLDPMNSFERRMIHSLVSKYENLKTESIGEGKERHIIIKYEEI